MSADYWLHKRIQKKVTKKTKSAQNIFASITMLFPTIFIAQALVVLIRLFAGNDLHLMWLSLE